MADRDRGELVVIDIPIHGGQRRATTSSVVHGDLAEVMARYGHGAGDSVQLTADELSICKLLGVTPADFAAQRARERSGEGGAGKWRSGAA